MYLWILFTLLRSNLQADRTRGSDLAIREAEMQNTVVSRNLEQEERKGGGV